MFIEPESTFLLFFFIRVVVLEKCKLVMLSTDHTPGRSDYEQVSETEISSKVHMNVWLSTAVLVNDGALRD